MFFMQKIDWLVGDEKRFADFISKLNDKDKIISLTHTDTDGITSGKMVKEVIDPDEIKFVDYYELNEDLVKELKEKEFNKIIMSDLFLNRTQQGFVKELEKFAEILIIDHHPVEIDWNSERTVFLNAQGYCAGYLCYVLFSKIKDLSYYDWLAACASIADFQFKENGEWLDEIYSKYGDEKFTGRNDEEIRKGKIWDMQLNIGLALIYHEKEGIRKVFDSIGEEGFGDIGDIGEHADEVQKEIDENIERFNKEKEEIGDILFWEMPELKFGIKSIVTTIVSVSQDGKSVIILKKKGDTWTMSARRQDMKKNMNHLLNSLTEGFEGSDAGGHVPAAGGHFPERYKEEFMKRLRKMKD